MLTETEFKNPGKWFRGIPFWSINDKLEAGELARQLKILEEGGFGGAFFHAREGLLTPYLSDEWFSRLKAVVEEASKLGMLIWLYDEDRWPSGFAGGYVPALGPEHRAKSIIMIPHTAPFNGGDVIAVFKCTTGDGLNLGSVKGLVALRLRMVTSTSTSLGMWHHQVTHGTVASVTLTYLTQTPSIILLKSPIGPM